MTAVERILERIEGCTIICGRVDEGEGLVLNFSDGTSLIVAGAFALELVRFEKDMRH